MVRRATIGWELGIPGNSATAARQLDGQNGTGTTAAVLDTGTKRTGNSSCKLAGTAANSSWWQYTFLTSWTSGDTWYVRVYFNVSALPTGTTRILYWTQGATLLLGVRLTAAGALQFWNDIAGTQVGSDWTGTVSTGTWYRVEMAYTFSSAGNETFELKVEGAVVASGNAAISATAPTQLRFGWLAAPGATCNMFLEDLGVNDSTGGNENNYPDDAKIVWLGPISDNARATLWTGGAGGTTNLFDAVNNTPPIGTATETNLTQIEHAGGAAGSTDAYDANLTTYTTAGLVATDTIKVIHGVINTGEDAASGTKLLSFEVTSNPTIASSGSFDVAPTSGALGTWPSAWWTTWLSPAYAPISVTLGNSPVMRVVRPETASGVASVDLMGLYVEYIPSLPPGAGPNPTEVVGALSNELAAMLHQGR